MLCIKEFIIRFYYLKKKLDVCEIKLIQFVKLITSSTLMIQVLKHEIFNIFGLILT